MKAIFILSFLLATTFVFGQELKTTENRVEIDINDGHFDEDFFTFGENGFVLKSFSYQDGRRGDLYMHHDLYDTNMVLIGEKQKLSTREITFTVLFKESKKCIT
jgi:hypothetical protein